MAFRRKRTWKKRAPKRRFAKKRGAKRPAIKRMIRREIARNNENKTQQYFNLNRNITSVGSGLDTANIIALGVGSGTLIVSQGAGQGQRIGNRIKTKKLTFKGTLVPSGYNDITNPQPTPVQVKIMILYDKTTPTIVPTPYFNGDFFQNGSGSTTFSNDLIDLWRPINTDRYRVLKSKTFKLGYQEFTGVGVSYAGAQQQQGNFSNNDFKLSCNFSFDLTKYYPKSVKFNDGSGAPTTRGLWALVLPVWANGGAGTPLNMANIQYMVDYHYEDA